MKHQISAARTVLAALVLTIAFAAALPGAASAGEGFGYNDPRSLQINPRSFDVLPDGGIVYLQDDRLYELTPAGRVVLLAGGGRQTVGLSPTPAKKARLGAIRVAATADGGVLVSGLFNSTIYGVTPEGTISRVAGDGKSSASGSDNGDGGPATEAFLQVPAGLAPTTGGGFLLADVFSASVREVTPDGMIDTIAGGNGTGAAGDGGPAIEAQLGGPFGLDVTADGGVLIGEIANARVRLVDPEGGITTVAGGNGLGFSGDGGAATAAQLSGSSQLAPVAGVFDIEATADGGFLLVDSGNRRIREVTPDGIIETVAGTGATGYNGDGIAAARARITPREIAPTADGGYLILDVGRIRKVSPGGEITTIAGMPAPKLCPASTYNGIQGTRRAESLRGGSLQDLIRGEGGSDRIEGDESPDCISGGRGSDRISAGAGGDVVVGENGADVIEGGNGPDELNGGSDDDAIRGGEGADRIVGDSGDDLLVGGRGMDQINSNDGSPDRVRCGRGKDKVRADKLDRVAPSCERVNR